MNPERYKRARDLFLDGLPLSWSRRAALLDERCGDDAEIRRQVEILWRNDDTDTALPEKLDATQAVERTRIDLTGRTAGAYRILELVGEGGMGSVYRAVDESLDREAALKFPAPYLIGDPSARSRFDREAKAAAALDHPNVCAVYGTGELEGNPFIAMAFLRGRTVEERIHDRPLPLREAFDLAAQAARGLGAAHARDIVHRDVKPANLMLVEQADGSLTVKVMDFGVAYVENATRITLTAAAIGTASYMAPEQTYTDDFDQRADVWSLGVVLYEMLVGERPFTGDDSSEVIEAIRKRQPEPASRRRPGLPPGADAVLAKALAKEPDRRYRDMKRFAADLEALLEDVEPTASKEVASRRRRGVLLGAGAVAAALAAATWIGSGAGEIELPAEPLASRPVTSDPGREWGPSLSPDGRTLAYSAAPPGAPQESDLFLHQVSGGAPVRLAPTEQAEFSPTWSPDGSEIAFLRTVEGERHELRIVPSLGGVDRLAASVRAPEARQLWRPPPHLDWAPDGGRLFIVDRGEGDDSPFYIAVLDLATGEKRRVSDPLNGIVGDLYPRVSPDGKRLAFARQQSNVIAAVMVAELRPDGSFAGSPRRLRAPGRPLSDSPAWTPDGAEVLFSAGSSRRSGVWAAPVDTLEPREILRADFRVSMLAVSAVTGGDGWTLSYVAQNPSEDLQRIALAAASEPPAVSDAALAETLFPSSYEDTHPAVSPDGSQVAFVSTRSGSDELWIGDPETGAVRQVTSLGGAGVTHPRWSPDGERIALVVLDGDSASIYAARPGQDKLEPLVVESSNDDRPEWSADGATLYFRSNRDGRRRIWQRALDGGEARLTVDLPMEVAVEGPGGAGLYGAFHGLWDITDPDAPRKLAGSSVFRVKSRPGGLLTRSADGLIRFYSLKTGAFEPVFQLVTNSGTQFSISGDDKWLYFSRPRQSQVDVMAAENLRERLR